MQVFIQRPVMAVALNLVLCIIGLIAFQQLPLRHEANKPNLKVEIRTTYPGAYAGVIEQRITKPLEDVLSGLDGIKKITSKSSDGFSTINVQFKSIQKYDQHLSKLREKILAARSNLPDSASLPVIWERGEDNNVLMYLVAKDPTRSIPEIYDYLQRNIIDRLKLQEGVAEVGTFGGKKYIIEVQLDPLKLAEFQLPVKSIVAAIRSEKDFAAGGVIETAIEDKTVIISSPFLGSTEIGDIYLGKINGLDIRLNHVAKVVVTHKIPDFVLFIDGQDTTGLSITVKPRANPLDVAKKIHKFIGNVNKSLPANMKLDVAVDNSIDFQKRIDVVYKSLFEAILFVGIIVTISLASIRAALVPMVTVPLCIISTFAVMLVLGFSLNPITLLAMVLAVGLVVDDAIVVIENIHRHMSKGLNVLKAAQKSMQEITFSIVAMTLTLAAVYVPIAFSQDEASYMFREFAWTLAGSVILSGFVALTLTPAMCCKFLNKNIKSDWSRLDNRYHTGLKHVITQPRKIIFMMLILFFLGAWSFLQLPSEFEPAEDKDVLYGWMVVENKLDLDVINSWVESLSEITNKYVAEKRRLVVFKWREFYWWHLGLVPRSERDTSAVDISKRLSGELDKIPGPMIGVSHTDSGSNQDESVNVILQYSGNTQRFFDQVKNLVNKISGLNNVAYVRSPELKSDMRYKVTVQRDIAAKLGVRVTDIEEVLYTLLSGIKATDFTFNNYDYDVIVRADEKFRTDLSSINQFFISGINNTPVPLGTLVEITEVLEARSINRHERIRSAKINVTLKPGYDFNLAISAIESLVKEYLSDNSNYFFSGKVEKYKEARKTMWITFALALAFIYLVLCALFESFLDPFIVLLTVPLSIVGAVLAIKSIGGTNNIYTQIGVITLIGLISKHGILIVDFSNRLLHAGKSLQEAVLTAAVARLRPILMTTLAMICGVLPLVLSQGAGANAFRHIGWVIIGGMTTGTIFSLFVIPVVYVSLKSLKHLKK